MDTEPQSEDASGGEGSEASGDSDESKGNGNEDSEGEEEVGEEEETGEEEQADCAPGLLDCDEDEPGCETEAGTVENCGGCKHECSIGPLDFSCVEGTCVGELELEAVADVTVDLSMASENFEGSDVLYVSPVPKRDALIDFFVPGGLPSGSLVDEAYLKLESEIAGAPVQLHRVLDGWNGLSVTWDSRPGVVIQPGAMDIADSGTMEIDVKGMVQTWADGAPMHGFEIRSNGPEDARLRASESGAGPTLAISLRW